MNDQEREIRGSIAVDPEGTESPEATRDQPKDRSIQATKQNDPEPANVVPASLTYTAQMMPASEPSRDLMPDQIRAAQHRRDASLVYALGSLGYDFGTEARRDSFAQHMGEPQNLHDPNRFVEYLEEQETRWEAASILWTLNIEATPIYVMRPVGAFASEVYRRLVQFLREQVSEGVERISVPGVIIGEATLMSGQVVPAVHPEMRCMYSWTTAALVEAVAGSPPEGEDEETQEEYTQRAEAVTSFLERVYYELQNLGLRSEDRALNYAATNALNISQVFESALREEMQLDTIEVERSSLCRPDADCWDVKLTFFDPQRQFERARKVYRFTVDVSDVCPVMVGKVRSWFVR